MLSLKQVFGQITFCLGKEFLDALIVSAVTFACVIGS